VCVLAAVLGEGERPDPVRGGYRHVLADRAFVRLALIHVAMIAIGWGVFSWLIPPYARNDLGVSARLIGLLLLANAATVVFAQVPIAKLAEGRRRVVMIALAGALFAGACALVVAARLRPGVAFEALVVAQVAVALGECCHTTAIMPLVAELAPASLRGRYMAAIGFSFWVGLTIAPTLGAQLLSASPAALFLVAGAVAAAAAASALSVERRLPATSRLTPFGNRAATDTGRAGGRRTRRTAPAGSR
jgi:MFS family permease